MMPRRIILGTFAATLLLTTGSALRKPGQGTTTPLDVQNISILSEDSTSIDSVKSDDSESAGLSRIYSTDERLIAVEGHRASDRFADVSLVTQEGKRVQFVRDLVRDRIVVINLTYTRCRGSCPATNARIMKLRRILGSEFGQRISFLSITVEPEHDTPEILAEFSDRFLKNESPDLPPWIFLTGKPEEIEELRYSLGLFDPDPMIDADRTKHAGLLTYGNDRTNRWAATPSDVSAEEIARTILRIAGETNNQRYSGLYSASVAP